MIQLENGNYTECSCREVEKAKRYMELSGLRPDQRELCIATYKPYDKITNRAKELCKDYMINFDQMKDTRENGLALLGQHGAGKTHLIVSVATNLINRKSNPVPVVYMPYIESMQQLKQNAFDDDAYWKQVNRYNKAKLLIIDDLFKDKVSRGTLIARAGLTVEDMKHIYPIINHRYLNNLPTVISSECTPEMLMDLDGALAGRILEPSKGHLVIFTQGHDYRMKKYKE